MMKTLFFATGLIVSLVLSACKPSPSAETARSSAAQPNTSAASTLPLLGPAPSWELLDVEGKRVRSADFAGKVVVLDFWATWCPPCRAEIPGYSELQKKYGDRGLVIIGVSLDEQGPSVVKTFAREQKVAYPLVMGNAEVTEAFGGVEGIPTTFLIDREGQIRHRKVGAMDTAEYERLIVSVLGL